MKRRKHSGEQIIGCLKQVGAGISAVSGPEPSDFGRAGAACQNAANQRECGDDA